MTISLQHGALFQTLDSWLFTLHSLSQVVAPPLFVDDWLVDLAGGQVVVSGQPDVEEALVVPQVQVHLAPVIQHKHLPWTEPAWHRCNTRLTRGCMIMSVLKENECSLWRTVLIGGKRAGIYVDVRVDLDGGYVQAAWLQDRAHAARNDAFADTWDDSSGYKDVLHHCALVSGNRRLIRIKQ